MDSSVTMQMRLRALAFIFSLRCGARSRVRIEIFRVVKKRGRGVDERWCAKSTSGAMRERVEHRVGKRERDQGSRIDFSLRLKSEGSPTTQIIMCSFAFF